MDSNDTISLTAKRQKRIKKRIEKVRSGKRANRGPVFVKREGLGRMFQ